MNRLFLIVAFVLIMPSAAYAACPCVQKSTGEKYGNAHTVFQGIMTKVEELPGDTRTERITFQLENSWKGTSGPVLEVIFPVSIDACGLPEEEIGRSYMVYARAQTTGELKSTMCDGTDLTDLLQADVRFLNDIYHPVTADPLVRFPDVPTTYPYMQAIQEYREKEIVSGFPDGTFRPDWPVTRAELAKILSKSVLPHTQDRLEETYAYTNTDLPFKDLDSRAWYNLFVRRAYRAGVITGFPDRTFRPADSVSVAEAFAMIVRGTKLETANNDGLWYEQYVRSLSDHHAIPIDIHALTEPITRAQVVEILWRLSHAIENRDSLSASDLLTKSCVTAEDRKITGVDLRRVRATWLALYNEERARRGLKPYSLSPELSRSATLWSEISAARGTMSHKRDGTTAYYDYSAIEQWFADLGLTFVNVKSQTFTENIGVGPYHCSDTDCTDELIAAIRFTFDFYLSEEPRDYRPHFNSIVNPMFTMLGMGLDVKSGQYFLTTHFATRFAATPPSQCSSK